ncbi:MAG: RuBisCO large subunit C-terminal-like domain-containing protein [Actinomycetota bacterium]
MLAPTDVAASGDRFTATYLVDPALGAVGDVARWMAGEMTVEFPLDLIDPDDGIGTHVVGRVEAVELVGGRHRVVISVADEVVSGSMTQLLSVVWGNVSLGRGVDLVDLVPPAAWTAPVHHDGPRGLAAFRALADAPTRPLLMSAIKPLGLPVDRLAAMAHELAAGGLDVVKEDQSLADQPWAPFDERIGPIAQAICDANDRHGTRAVYAPSLNGPVVDLPRRAAAARDAGAGAVMVQPGISGYPAIEAAATAGLPVIAHPGGFGGLSDRVAPALVHGLLPRMAGADCSVFIVPGGRFPIEEADALATVGACLHESGDLPVIMAAAGGGVSVERVPQLRATYGDDLCLLIGGDLHRDGDPRRRASLLREAAER